MSAADQFADFDAIGQAELVHRGDAAPVELVESAIARIERLNPKINAVVTSMFDEALVTARALPSGPLRDAPLAGVPFLLKDLGLTIGGVRQTDGSRSLRDFVPRNTSELVRRYQRAGLVVLGKTNTPEFGNHSTTEPVLFGPTLNPWALDRTTGGSSGGSAAAVAVRMVPAAHGSDGGGSLRIPASCCGLVGLKPTRGRNSRSPMGDVGASLNVEHAITRSVRDTAAILDATAGPLPGDPFITPLPTRPFLAEVGSDPGRLRVGWTARPPVDVPVAGECADAVQSTAVLLASLGHVVEEAEPTFDGDAVFKAMGRIWAASNAAFARSIATLTGRRPEDDEFELTTREMIEVGRGLDAADLLDAFDALADASRAIAPFFDRYHVWLTPTIAQLPMPLGVLNKSYGGGMGWWHFDIGFNPWNPVANITGRPAISLPLAWSSEGLPIGSLLTGRFGDEATLFRLASQLEAARPWADRRPHALNE